MRAETWVSEGRFSSADEIGAPVIGADAATPWSVFRRLGSPRLRLRPPAEAGRLFEEPAGARGGVD